MILSEIEVNIFAKSAKERDFLFNYYSKYSIKLSKFFNRFLSCQNL